MVNKRFEIKKNVRVVILGILTALKDEWVEPHTFFKNNEKVC